MNRAQWNRIERVAVEIAKRLGTAAGDSFVEEESCDSERIGLMGSYERRHFGLTDFEEEFTARLWRTVERAGGTVRDFDEILKECWYAWVSARNARVLELCPKAREYA